MKRSRSTSRNCLQAGFTLIELGVSILILGIVIIGVTSMLQQSREVSRIDSYRRQARIHAMAELEKTAYRYDSIGTVENGFATSLVWLDSGAARSVHAIMTVDISTDSVTWPDGNSGFGGTVNLPYRKVRAVLRWTPDSRSDSVFLTRRIALGLP